MPVRRGQRIARRDGVVAAVLFVPGAEVIFTATETAESGGLTDATRISRSITMDHRLVIRRGVCTAIAATLAATIGAAQAHSLRKPTYSRFEFATINVERNETDGDTEIVITAKAGDEGLLSLVIFAPDGRPAALAVSPDRTTLGLREFVFESPEPEGSRILAAYPEGTYTFIGKSTVGEEFRARVPLSHRMPAPATIVYPLHESVISTDTLTLQWTAVPGVKEYVIELENESADPEQVLRVNVPASQSSFEVPQSMLVPGADYQLGVWTVGTNGNILVAEITFTTEG
jgi:hypothetical protein